VRPSKIKGEKIIQRYLASGPTDKGATPNQVSTKLMAYTYGHDLAIFELRHPLPNYHGVRYSLEDLEPGLEVDIYGYPLEGINPVRKLLQFHATFKAKTTSGLLAFDYSPAGGKTIRGGASGGVVVDRKTQQVVGILNSVAKSGELIATAVPVQSLVDFVAKVQPYLAQDIFPSLKLIHPITADLYPKFVPVPADGLRHRTEEPAEVKLLREKAQKLADDMRDFIAVQSFAWGGDRKLSAQADYEVRVIDGVQKFRRYPDGRDELKEVPRPGLSGWALPADEWSALPRMVGTEFRLKIRQAADVTENDQHLKVFQYYASVEDNLCPFEAVDDYVFFAVGKPVAVACYGEVWTDKDFNVVRMSENLDLSDKLKAYRGWEEFRVVLTYSWLNRTGEPAKIVPLTIFTESHDKKHIYWCRGQFTDYRKFSSRAKLILPNGVTETAP
jgi:hypothetical protein